MLHRWAQPNGYRDVLTVGLPLVVSMGTVSLIYFTDRVFLSNYAVDAIAAAMPAGITSFLFLSFFMGVASYVNVFIAQYTGAAAPHRVGASLWQGIYFSMFSSLVLATLYFAAEPLFRAGGHPEAVQHLEVIYFRILILGSGLVVTSTTLSCFFSGRGMTKPVMMVNLMGAAINIPLDYCLINGVWFFPELGIAGAGLATVTAEASVVALFALLVFTKSHNARFAVWRGRGADWDLLKRLMWYGLPGGVEFFIDIFAITFFVFMVGRLGRTELAATNIVFAINTLAFLPMIGFSIGVSTLVGQALGRGIPQDAVEAARSTFHICFSYMALVAAVFVLAPERLLGLFHVGASDAREFARITATGVVLLRFVALYTLFDAMAIIYFGVLKGAGDIHFVMRTICVLSTTVMIVPVYLGVERFDGGLYFAWTCITLYVALLGVVFWLRYRGGKWKHMRVIESDAGAHVYAEARP